MITMPVNGQFKMKCIHCDRESPNKPIHFKDDNQDFSLVECPSCHKSTLIRFPENVASLFKVEY